MYLGRFCEDDDVLVPDPVASVSSSGGLIMFVSTLMILYRSSRDNVMKE